MKDIMIILTKDFLCHLVYGIPFSLVINHNMIFTFNLIRSTEVKLYTKPYNSTTLNHIKSICHLFR